MSKIHVALSSPYDITVEAGALATLGAELKKLTRANRVMVVTDSNVEKLYLKRTADILKDSGFCVSTFVFGAGERSKTPSTYLDIISALASNGFKRTDAVVALGGGVVGDVAGFASATYMRGIAVVQVPTTLLAMIDSAIGGKTGVDLPCGKNLLGAFHQPKAVIADVDLLSTLPEAEWRNGKGEGIKYACLAGGRIAQIMADGLNEDSLCEFVALCAKYKADVVAEDEKEGGLRKLLNLGHTVGHAIEANSDFCVSHGVAVAQGIAVMALAQKRIDKSADFEAIDKMLKNLGITSLPEITDQIIEAIAMDKKTEGKDEISFVKILGVGNCEVQKSSLSDFAKYISD